MMTLSSIAETEETIIVTYEYADSKGRKQDHPHYFEKNILALLSDSGDKPEALEIALWLYNATKGAEAVEWTTMGMLSGVDSTKFANTSIWVLDNEVSNIYFTDLHDFANGDDLPTFVLKDDEVSAFYSDISDTQKGSYYNAHKDDIVLLVKYSSPKSNSNFPKPTPPKSATVSQIPSIPKPGPGLKKASNG